MIEDSNDAYSVTSKYIFGGDSNSLVGELHSSDERNLDTEFFVFQSLRVRDARGNTIVGAIPAAEQVYVEMRLRLKKRHRALSFGYSIYNEAGNTVYWTMTTDANDQFANCMNLGDIELSTKIPPRFLNQGLYRLEFMAGLHYTAWFAEPGSTDLAVFLKSKAV